MSKQNLQTTPELQNEEKLLQTAILISVEMDSNFKLYSYRCIDKKSFIDRLNGLIKTYQDIHNLKKTK